MECRYCLSDEGELVDLPCHCKGTMGKVHIKCQRMCDPPYMCLTCKRIFSIDWFVMHVTANPRWIQRITGAPTWRARELLRRGWTEDQHDPRIKTLALRFRADREEKRKIRELQQKAHNIKREMEQQIDDLERIEFEQQIKQQDEWCLMILVSFVCIMSLVFALFIIPPK